MATLRTVPDEKAVFQSKLVLAVPYNPETAVAKQVVFWDGSFSGFNILHVVILPVCYSMVC